MPEPWDLPAGNEIDALVALRVMGWRQDATIPDLWHRPDRLPGGLWGFSQAMGPAWHVVEKMVARIGADHPRFYWAGPTFKAPGVLLDTAGIRAYPIDAALWQVTVQVPAGVFHHWAETPALAICRAALWCLDPINL
jgi:hypothetical protein